MEVFKNVYGLVGWLADGLWFFQGSVMDEL